MTHEAEFQAKGRWNGVVKTPGDSLTIDDKKGVFPVHAALMHTGRVLLFSGNAQMTGTAPYKNYLYRSWSWDPDKPLKDARGRWFLPEFDSPPDHAMPGMPLQPATWQKGNYIDMFCSHHVFLDDGRLLVIGGAGNDNEGDENGIPAVHVYDPVTEKWSRFAGLMKHGRWYPTPVVMPDGRVAIFSGCSKPYAGVAQAEVVGAPKFEPAVIAGADRSLFIYPGMHLVPGGRVFYVPTAWRYSPATYTGKEADLQKLGPELRTESFRFTSSLADAATGSWEEYHDPGDSSKSLLPANPLREEGTSVLLPPARDGRILLIGGGWANTLAQDNYHLEKLVLHEEADALSAEILETQGAQPEWKPAGTMHHPRISASAVLLPDGKVLIVGGHNLHKRNKSKDPNGNYKRIHSKRAEIYDPVVGSFTEVPEMHKSLMYHSVALLLPDGRVFTAGGEDNFVSDDRHEQDQKTIEIYDPPYCFMGQRPEILGVDREGGPDDQILYGGTFFIDYKVPSGAKIEKVVLMRPGAITHHTDTEQRYEDIPFAPVGDRLLAYAPSDPSILPPGYYMLWIVDDKRRPCKRARFVRLSHEHCRLVTDKSHYSSDEYAASTGGVGGEATFENAFYVVLHGFIPSDLGIVTATPSQNQLAAYAPPVSVTDASGGLVSSVSAHVRAMHLEVVGGALDVRQRITFEYAIHFSDGTPFPTEGAIPDMRTLTLSTTTRGYACAGQIVLTRKPNPHMLDGATHWLSLDLRVFAVHAGKSAPGLPARVLSAGSPDPHVFLAGVLDDYRKMPPSWGHPFNSLPTDQQDASLYLSQEGEEGPVFNFAVARVRYRGLALTAKKVRVFFRLFTTAATSLEYRVETYPHHTAGDHVVPDLGANATDVLSIPFFAAPRESVSGSGDPENVQSISPDPGGAEVNEYYGTWLDFNQPTPRYVDPEDGVLKSIQELIKGRHQCLVAEICFEQDPIPSGATPASNDNLAQRNLAIELASNPGNADSHTILHTFDLRPNWFLPGDGGTDLESPSHTSTPSGAAGVVSAHRRPTGPDELMILWGNLPRDSEVSLYFPALDADDIVRLAHIDYGPTRLERVDAHTLACQVADVTYVPLPARGPRHLAGLLTIRLPNSVKNGQQFRVEVRQVVRSASRVVGTFEILIPVSADEGLLPEAERTLSVMRHIATKIGPSSRWYPIFERYLEGLAGRVRGFGGDPSQVAASTTGVVQEPKRPSGKPSPKPRPEDCLGVAGELLECLGCGPEDVKAVRVRRVTVDIDVKEDDC
jgi:galactose oxidase-like protein